MEKVGVLHVILNPGGGAWTVIRVLSCWQKERMPVAIGIGYRKKSVPNLSITESKGMDIPIFLFNPSIDFPNSSAILLPPLRKWYKSLQTSDPFVHWVVHFHNGPGIGFAFWPNISPRPRFPFAALVTFHGIPPEDVIKSLRKPLGQFRTYLNGFLVRRMWEYGIKLSTLSYASRIELASTYKIPEKAVKVVYNGVPGPGVENFGNIEHRGSSFVVGFVGNIGRKKRWDIAVDAVVRLKKNCKDKDIKLLIAGQGPEVDRLRKYISPYSGFIEYLGEVRNAGSSLIPFLDCLVLPAEHEGQPMVILEAMACGVPSIATSVGAIPETIKHGETGFIISSASSADLSYYLNYLMDHPQIRTQMRETCMREWKTRFSVEVMGNNYMQLYKEILSEKGSMNS